MINRALYETLLTYKGGDASTPVPGVASKWKVNANATEFTFTINPKAKFSDGTKITSADVVFSLNRLKNIKGNPSSLMNGITVAAPNASTVVLTTANPTPQVLAIVTSPALGILNSKVLKANGGSDAADAATADKALEYLKTKSVGSGPYVLKSFNLTTEVVLEKNKKYWGTPAAYDQIVVRNVPVNVQRLNAIKGSSSIAVDLSPDRPLCGQGCDPGSWNHPKLLLRCIDSEGCDQARHCTREGCLRCLRRQGHTDPDRLLGRWWSCEWSLIRISLSPRR
jgi:peptide/nickel transport system substrate-binding protein